MTVVTALAYEKRSSTKPKKGNTYYSLYDRSTDAMCVQMDCVENSRT